MFGLSVFNVVGKIANIIRLVICVGLLVSAVVTLLIAIGIFTSASVSSGLLYAMVVITVVGMITVAFDCSTSQWLIQKVLSRLTEDVSRFEADLAIGEQQLKEREKQLKQSADQIKRQEIIIADITLIQSNMSNLVTSLVDAHRDGLNINELFTANLHKFDFLLSKMTDQVFTEMDLNDNGAVERNEYLIYVNKMK